MSTPPPSTGSPGSGDPSVITPPASPMDPVIPLVVGIFLGVIAYFLYGQWQKGVGGLVLYVVLLVLSFVTCGLGSFLFLPLHVMTIVDAYMQSKLLKDGVAIRQWTFFTQAA